MKNRFFTCLFAMAIGFGLFFNSGCSNEEELLELPEENIQGENHEDDPIDLFKDNEALIDPDFPYYMIFDMEVDGITTKVVANGTKKSGDYEFEASSLYCGSSRTHYEYQTTCKPADALVGDEEVHTYYLSFRRRCPNCELEDNLQLGDMPFTHVKNDWNGAGFGIMTRNVKFYTSNSISQDNESFMKILSIEDHPTFDKYKIIEARFQCTIYYSATETIRISNGIMRGLISSTRHMDYVGED